MLAHLYTPLFQLKKKVKTLGVRFYGNPGALLKTGADSKQIHTYDLCTSINVEIKKNGSHAFSVLQLGSIRSETKHLRMMYDMFTKPFEKGLHAISQKDLLRINATATTTTIKKTMLRRNTNGCKSTRQLEYKYLTPGAKRRSEVRRGRDPGELEVLEEERNKLSFGVSFFLFSKIGVMSINASFIRGGGIKQYAYRKEEKIKRSF